jgi:hypothetical protein
MKYKLLLPLCFFLPACALFQGTFFQRPFRPAHAAPEEAAQVRFPLDLPANGRVTVRGPMAAAMQLAMDDFLPRGIKPPAGASAVETCLHQRDSYDIFAAPGSEGVMFVTIALSPQACKMEGPVLDVGAMYAVDLLQWRILAIKR